ncbi:hypothetical protein [Stenotrophomonas acidaminiphila]|nr:hypothetical protein [Stenotrophomonas acidaminiphila]
MAKINYSYEKRQRELAKKKQKDEKLAWKRAPNGTQATGPADPPASTS